MVFVGVGGGFGAVVVAVPLVRVGRGVGLGGAAVAAGFACSVRLSFAGLAVPSGPIDTVRVSSVLPSLSVTSKLAPLSPLSASCRSSSLRQLPATSKALFAAMQWPLPHVRSCDCSASSSTQPGH